MDGWHRGSWSGALAQQGHSRDKSGHQPRRVCRSQVGWKLGEAIFFF